MLRERGQHVQHEPVRMGIVATHEVRPALHQRGNKSDIAAQAVELRYYERGFLPAALLQRGEQLRAVGMLLALSTSVYSVASWPAPI
jgi:hypothetical protein